MPSRGGGGAVVARVAHDLSAKGILAFLREYVDPQGSLLITDEYKGYNKAQRVYQSAMVNHKERYADGKTHTNTFEGFWSLVKRAWYGSHHHYSTQWMPLYVAESTWKYNQRKNPNGLGTFMRECFA